MVRCIGTDTYGIGTARNQRFQDIARAARAMASGPRISLSGASRNSKRIGKFAAGAGARHEALDMYPREWR